MIIHKYKAPWSIYGMHWSIRPDKKFRLALGSFIEEYTNKVEIIELHKEETDKEHKFVVRNSFDHPYPCTKIQWIPDTHANLPDLLATSGDYLRIWQVKPNKADPKADIVENIGLLNTNRMNMEYCAPLTSFDWNEIDPNLIGVSSIDTTCTIWNIDTGQVAASTKKIEARVKTQLIAHDEEVYDIAFSKGQNGREQFASVGADGSVRMFDLRCLEHSTIMYESETRTFDDVGAGQWKPYNARHHGQHQARTPLVRLAWNKQDNNYLATMPLDSTEIIILDVRYPCTPCVRLNEHRACVNGLCWAPHSSCHICTVGDDSQALIWDISGGTPKIAEEPILAYTAGAEINQVHWSQLQTDWIAICFDNDLEILRV